MAAVNEVKVWDVELWKEGEYVRMSGYVETLGCAEWNINDAALFGKAELTLMS